VGYDVWCHKILYWAIASVSGMTGFRGRFWPPIGGCEVTSTWKGGGFAYFQRMDYDYDYVYEIGYFNKYGFSVRSVQDGAGQVDGDGASLRGAD